MKTNLILGMLLAAVAASADARFAPPFPPKALPPDESGQWVVINGNPWSHAAGSEHVTFADRQTRRGAARPSGSEPKLREIVAK